MNPLSLTDDQIRATPPEQLSDLYAALEVAEIKADKPVVMLDAALWYARKLSWPIFPLKPRGKKPATAHGFKDATCDLDRIRAWWRENADYNIGVPTGAKDSGGCGYDVLDIDGPAGILAWAQIKHAKCAPGCSDEQFCPAPGPFDVQARAFTPGNGVDRGPGRHLFIPATGKGNAAGIGGQPIDYRGAGGYVVVAPSANLTGQRYTWINRPAAT